MSRVWMSLGVLVVTLGLFSPATYAQSAPPQVYTSKTFQLMTDLPPDQAKELMEKLETMVKLVSAYYGSPCRKPIRMYVVDKLSNWPAEELQQMPANGQAAIRNRAGVTLTTTRGIRGGPKLDADAVVYAVADHGTAQHEAVHAYCGITFGETGPVWYSEGMAEVGQYFRPNEKGVNAADYVIEYLKSREPKPLMDIVNNPLETTGDSWQNYAWRWAVCHLLGYNTNYAPRFKPLGLSLLAGNDTSFQNVYGEQIPEIDFEYKLFLKNLAPGYRCDLCSWDWNTRFKAVTGSTQVVAKIDAQRGWQPSRGLVKATSTYQSAVTGEWATAPGADAVSAAGNAQGHGTLMGIVFDDYTLSEPFEIGDARTFTAPKDGQLFLRCRDDWGALADNKGTVSVRIKLAGQ